MTYRPSSLKLAAVLAGAFGCATLVAGARALFGGADMGAVVPFVLWFNFGAAPVYLLAALGLWLGAGWGRGLALVLAVATGVVFAAFLSHILRGAAWEPRTLAAMAVRLGFWLWIADLAYRRAPK